MDLSLLQSSASPPASPFPRLAVGFMGLGTGYLMFADILNAVLKFTLFI